MKNFQKHTKNMNFLSKSLVFESDSLESRANHSCRSFYRARRAIRSQSLFCKEQQEGFTRGRSYQRANRSKSLLNTSDFERKSEE